MKIKDLSFLKVFALSICLFALLGLVATGTVSATTYYVAPTGADANDGSSARPFKTIQRAADIVNPGDTVIVRKGTYTDPKSDGFVVRVSRSGTPSAFITFKSEILHGAVLDGVSQQGTALYFATGASYIRFEGFEVTRTYNGISWSIGNAYNPAYIYHDVVFFRNHFHDIGRITTTTAYGMGGTGAPPRSYNIVYDSNLFHHMGRINESHLDQVIYLCGYNQTIINNVFYNSDGWRGWPVSVSAEYDAGDGKNIRIINNTFGDPNPKPYKDGHIVVSWQVDQQIENLVISNNIFYNPQYACVFFWSPYAQKVKSAYIRNNIATVSNIVSQRAGQTNWINANVTYSNNRLSTDPQFVDAANNDYHLSPTSPAINFGNATDAPNHDYDGFVRPQGAGPDAGAYYRGKLQIGQPYR